MRRIVVGIVGIVVAAGAVAFWAWPRGEIAPPPTPPGPRLLWSFEAPRPGSVIAAPLIAPDGVYLAAVHAQGFRVTGAVYALNPATGKPRWVFDRDGEMLPTASSPVFAGGRLIFGEGMHANFSCKLYALDPGTGKQVWAFDTGDHIEGGPATDGTTVYFPAGNDGVYAVDVASGRRRWNFREDVHIDSSPAIVNGRAYVGSGTSRRYKTTQVICLDAATGGPVWRAPVPLPAWATPLAEGGQVYAGLGNGRLTEGARPPEVPAGALVCLDAASGAMLWTFPVGDAVFTRPVAARGAVVFGSRDGHLYGLSEDGRERFRLSTGGPIISSPAIDRGFVYAVTVTGRIVCINILTGQEIWRRELPQPGAVPQVFAPVRVVGDRLFVAAEMQPPGSSIGIVSLLCFELPPDRGRPEGSR